MTLRELWGTLLRGGPGFCQVALTNACNARCRFCSFPQVPAAARVMADPQRLHRGLEALKRAGVEYLSLTGGEPLLYPDLLPVLSRARDLRINTLLCTNGALLTSRHLQSLREAGLGTLIISLDAPAAAEHDRHRGLPGLTAHIRGLLPEMRRTGLDPVASVTLSRLVGDLGKMVTFVHELGFTRLTFSYPLNHLNSDYLGFAAHYSVDFTAEELSRWFERIKELKSTAPVSILNPHLGLTDLQRQLSGKPIRFPCLAGYKYFFADWHLQVHRCHYLDTNLGPLEEIHRVAPIRDGCSACTIDCYRDPSVYQYVAVSVADALKAWGRGEWLKGLGALFHPHNFLSLAALLEGRHWVCH